MPTQICGLVWISLVRRRPRGFIEVKDGRPPFQRRLVLDTQDHGAPAAAIAPPQKLNQPVQQLISLPQVHATSIKVSGLTHSKTQLEEIFYA